MDYEYVYIFTNPAIPDYVKVGITKNIKERLQELSSKTSIPLPFECYAYLRVPAGQAQPIEKHLHKVLSKSITKTKEFFKSTPEEVLDFFEGYPIKKAKLFINGKKEIKSEEIKKAVPSTFALLNIPIGSVLYYKDNPDIKCTVYDEKNNVEYNGNITTLSRIVCEIKQYPTANGFEYFIYQNEILTARRKRLKK